MIQNIIFDIGNVLTDFRWREFLQDKGFEDEMLERIAGASVESEQWHEFDRGIWTEEELMAAFVANDPEIEQELHTAFDNVHDIVRIRNYAIEWVQELKRKGYRVLYLSNFPEKADVECQDALGFIPYMDGGILSYKEKIIKPDAAIYKLLLTRYQMKPEECVFLDDTLRNVEAARALGIAGILFQTKEQAEEELRALGVC